MVVHGGEGPACAVAGTGGLTVAADSLDDGGQKVHEGRYMEHHGRGRESCAIFDDFWCIKLGGCNKAQGAHWKQLHSGLAPLGRKGHTGCLMKYQDEMVVVLFGGKPTGRTRLSNATYHMSANALVSGDGSWSRSQYQGNPPCPRQCHGCAVLGQDRAQMAVYGGVADGGELLGDLYILHSSSSSLVWRNLPSQPGLGGGPSGRLGHTCSEWPAGHSLLVFGGAVHAGEGPDRRLLHTQDIHCYDLKRKCWKQLETGHAYPEPRQGHSMCLVAGWRPPAFSPEGDLVQSQSNGREPFNGNGGDALVMCGGHNSVYLSSDVWVLPLELREKVAFGDSESVADTEGQENAHALQSSTSLTPLKGAQSYVRPSPKEAEADQALQAAQRCTFQAQAKLAGEVARRMALEARLTTTQSELQAARTDAAQVEAETGQEVEALKRALQEEQARANQLEQVLTEAYDLFQIVGLQHHLQVRQIMRQHPTAADGSASTASGPEQREVEEVHGSSGMKHVVQRTVSSTWMT
ncbi:unnamed protein product [Chrysoparadoxa australica]